MKREYFIDLENKDNQHLPLSDVIAQLAFNDDGLIPVITQDATTKSILMFAWMNKASLQQTLTTKRMTYFSRSRQKLWIKGESSGHSQKLISMAFDCDGDVVLCQAEQHRAACHTGRQSCFYLQVNADASHVHIDANDL
jgi:phosphoribosyl-AMP cyclohydrolase